MRSPNSSRTARQGGEQPDIRRMVRDEVAAILKTEIENIQAMVGDRGPKDGSMRAVRRGDVARVGAIALKSAYAAGGTPTAAEHNALVDDMKTLAAIIERFCSAFSG